MQPPPLDLPNERPVLYRVRIAIYGFLLRLLIDTIALPRILWPHANRLKTYVDTGKTGKCRVCVYTPALKVEGSIPRPVVVHLHGGGWTIRPENEAPLCRYLCNTLGVVVVAPDYRKAPRYPYPHALEQCYSVLTWIATGGLSLELKKHKNTPVINPAHIALSGTSAGSNLAAALTLLAITRPLPSSAQISSLALLYPVLNLAVPFADKLARVDPARVLPPWMSRLFLLKYLPPPRRLSDPYVSPALAPRHILACFPPTVILTAAYDYLAHEAEEFAAILNMEGVRVTHKRFKDVGHAFDALPTANMKQRVRNERARIEAWGMIAETFAEELCNRKEIYLLEG